MVLAVFIGIVLSIKLPNNIFYLLIIPLLLLAPGRLQGYLYREHFKGRKLMLNKQYKQALVEFKNFLSKLEHKKWLKKTIWLGGFVYTKDIEAMSLNNAGACFLELGELENSKSYLESALMLDNEYAIPYFNLAIINELEGNHQLAVTNLNRSIELGFSNTSIDQVLIKAQELYARIEGGSV